MRKITYGFYDSSLGEMVLGQTEKGLAWLGFMVDGYKGNGLERMRAHFAGFSFEEDNTAVEKTGNDIMNAWKEGDEKSIDLDLHGTAFQKAVWAALCNIPQGKTVSYGDIACTIGKPKASRAVGSAVGTNPVSLIVPCHRVLQKSGAIGNFGWGVDLKRQILCEEGVVC